MNAALSAWAAPHLSRLEPELLAAVGDAPPGLVEALRYPLLTGGKRIRPLLVFACAEVFRGAGVEAMAAAVAVELVHTYSLVHDDLPAMDDDDERRGRPTVHVVFGEATAILVGDGLLTCAFEQVAAYPSLVRGLAKAAGGAGMVGGQFLDIQGKTASLGELQHLHRLKTGALLQAACVMGGMAAGADAAQLVALSRYGAAIGLSFQVADDVLDADQDAGEHGPPSYVRLLGLDATRAEALRLADEAVAAVSGLPNSTILVELARFAVQRTV